jgi:DNA-binding XRE family transcriptional regulator
MKPSRRKRLERAAFTVAGVQEFPRLSDKEMALIDLKARLIGMLKSVRQRTGTPQHALARLIGSSQSRVAKMETGATDVSLDLICKALFAMKVSRGEIARTISKRAA